MPVNVITEILDLELTRKCIDQCAICLRGLPQKLEMTPNIIDHIFYNNNHRIIAVGDLFITGGEPFLNKKTFIYLLKYIINNNIDVKQISLVTNSLVYDEEIMELLNYLYNSGINIVLFSSLNQYHKEVPKENIKKFSSFPFYNYEKVNIKKSDIVRLGRAEENNLGSVFDGLYRKTKFKLAPLDKVEVLKVYNDKVFIKSLYVIADGRFGKRPYDSTWDMIDEKYKLNLFNDSIFKNCRFVDDYELSINNIKQGKILLPQEDFIADYNRAQEKGYLDIFLAMLSENDIRDYLMGEKSWHKILLRNRNK